MNNIVLLTATYNHCVLLPTLYKSLLNQEYKAFSWIIVDDGSKDDTEKVARGFIDEGNIDLTYIKKSNGGKSSAINTGLDLIPEDAFVAIIDDDENLLEDATKRLNDYYMAYYKKNNIGLINFQRINKTTGKFFANYDVNEDLFLSYFDFKAKGYGSDGYVAYFGYAIKDIRFPLFFNEKYVGPSVLMMLVNKKYDMLWSKVPLGESEYLEGGITKQGRRLRLKNPCGMITYCILHQAEGVPIKLKIKYSIEGFAYINISGKSSKELKSNGIDIGKLNVFCKPAGLILASKWKKLMK